MDVRHQPDHMTGRRDYLDLALINYNLAVDMTDSFHWNVKMIFLYMVAEYTNEDNSVNQVGLERERERERERDVCSLGEKKRNVGQMFVRSFV